MRTAFKVLLAVGSVLAVRRAVRFAEECVPPHIEALSTDAREYTTEASLPVAQIVAAGARQALSKRPVQIALLAGGFFVAEKALKKSGIVTPQRVRLVQRRIDRVAQRLSPLSEIKIGQPGSWVSAATMLIDGVVERSVRHEVGQISYKPPEPDYVAEALTKLDLDTVGRLAIDLEGRDLSSPTPPESVMRQVLEHLLLRDLPLKWEGCLRTVLCEFEPEEGVSKSQVGIIALNKELPIEKSVCMVLMLGSQQTGRGSRGWEGAWDWFDHGADDVMNHYINLVEPCDPELRAQAWEATRRWVWTKGSLLLESNAARGLTTRADKREAVTLRDGVLTASKSKRASYEARAGYDHDISVVEANSIGYGVSSEQPAPKLQLQPLNLSDAVFFGPYKAHYARWAKLHDLGQQHHVLIYGKPGCGKSTLIREWAHTVGQDRALFVSNMALGALQQNLWTALVYWLGASVVVLEDLDKAGRNLDSMMWLVEHQAGIKLLFATANAPQNFSSAMRRAGRLGDQVVLIEKPAPAARAELLSNLIERHQIKPEVVTPALLSAADRILALHSVATVERYLLLANTLGEEDMLAPLPGDQTWEMPFEQDAQISARDWAAHAEMEEITTTKQRERAAMQEMGGIHKRLDQLLSEKPDDKEIFNHLQDMGLVSERGLSRGGLILVQQMEERLHHDQDAIDKLCRTIDVTSLNEVSTKLHSLYIQLINGVDEDEDMGYGDESYTVSEKASAGQIFGAVRSATAGRRGSLGTYKPK